MSRLLGVGGRGAAAILHAGGQSKWLRADFLMLRADVLMLRADVLM